MKLFACQACDNLLYFENIRCESCGRALGFIPEQIDMSALEPDGSDWTSLSVPSVNYRFCLNAGHGVCNWLVRSDSGDELCFACRHNRTIPDLAAPGSALTAVGVTGGTAVAAANVAIQAARLNRARPELTPEQLRATLIAAGQPHDLPPDRAGAGVVAEPTSGVTADPPTAESGPLDPVTVELNAANTTPVTLTATGGAVPTPNALTLTPGAPAAINIRLPKPGTTTGRLEARNGNAVVASVPWLIHPDDVEPIAVGEPKIDRGGRRVRFTLGRFQRGPQTEVQVAEKLILDLVDGDGKPRRTLTFRGGARELMPAEYAYTLPAGTRDGLTFRIRAWAPNQDEPTTRTAR